MTHKARRALLVISEDGFAKRVPLEDFPVQHRGTQGVPGSSVPVAAALVVDDLVGAAFLAGVDLPDDVLIVTAKGKVERVAVHGIPMRRRRRTTETGKFSKGVRVIRLAKGDRVATACLCPLDAPLTLSQSPPNGLGAPDWPWGTTGLQEGDRLAVAALVLHPPRPLATITPGGKPAVPRDEWAQTDVHKASTYSCAHCGLQYEHPQDVYGCIDRHAAEVAPRALAA